MLSLVVRVGEAVQIGDVACVAVDEKSGNRVKLRIATPVKMPITLIPSGLIPRRFVYGMTGEPRPIPPRLAAVG